MDENTLKKLSKIELIRLNQSNHDYYTKAYKAMLVTHHEENAFRKMRIRSILLDRKANTAIIFIGVVKALSMATIAFVLLEKYLGL